MSIMSISISVALAAEVERLRAALDHHHEIAEGIAERKERLREAAQAVVDMWVRDGHSTETGRAIERLRVVLEETR